MKFFQRIHWTEYFVGWGLLGGGFLFLQYLESRVKRSDRMSLNPFFSSHQNHRNGSPQPVSDLYPPAGEKCRVSHNDPLHRNRISPAESGPDQARP